MAAKEFNITGWLDPLLEHLAKQAGISTADYTAQVGGEGIGVGLELVADYFTKGWLNKLTQFTAGLIAGSYAIWGRDISPRFRKELVALGTHELLRIAKLTPEDIKELQESLTGTIKAAQAGDVSGVLASVLKTPSELGLAPAPSEIVAPSPAPVQVAPPVTQAPGMVF
jgi:hypothetical protein